MTSAIAVQRSTLETKPSYPERGIATKDRAPPADQSPQVAERQASAGARDGVKGKRNDLAARAPLHAIVRRHRQLRLPDAVCDFLLDCHPFTIHDVVDLPGTAFECEANNVVTLLAVESTPKVEPNVSLGAKA